MTWAVSSMTKQILKSAKCLFLDEDLLMKPCLCILLPFPAVSAEIALITASLSHFIMSFYFFPPFIFFPHSSLCMLDHCLFCPVPLWFSACSEFALGLWAAWSVSWNLGGWSSSLSWMLCWARMKELLRWGRRLPDVWVVVVFVGWP